MHCEGIRVGFRPHLPDVGLRMVHVDDAGFIN